MKRRLLNLFTLIGLGAVTTVSAQNIPNGGFENWSPSPTYETLDMGFIPFGSSNNDGGGQVLTMTKINGKTGFGMKVENVLLDNDTITGHASWGSTDEDFNNGIPLGGNGLTGFSMSYKSKINPTTPGFIAIIPTLNGQAVGPGNGLFPGAYVFPISGDQTTFKDSIFTFSPALAASPDSVVIFLTASDQIDTEEGTPGDYIIVDDLAWVGSTSIFPNGDLENWKQSESIDVLDNWNLDYYDQNEISFEKVTDKTEGNYALRLFNHTTNRDTMIGRVQMGEYKDCNDGGPCTQAPGMAIPSKPSSMGFYYKYSSPGLDTGRAHVNLTDNGTDVANAWTEIKPTTGWEFMSMPINQWNTGTPDSAFISFESGDWEKKIPNSELIIDDVKFHYCDETLNIMGEANLCSGTNGATFNVGTEFGSAYSWTTNTGTINGSISNENVIIDGITSSGVVEVTKSYNDGCPDKKFNINITIASSASTNAGPPQTLCANNSDTHLEGTVNGAVGGKWTTNGEGSFDDDTDLNTTYTPSGLDFTNGVILTLDPTGIGTCSSTNSSVAIAFTAAPTVNAGTDADVCGDGSRISISATSSTGTGMWKNQIGNGQGFDNANSLATTYTPSGGDLVNGSVTLSFETTGNGNCLAEVAIVNYTIEEAPMPNAGSDQLICNTASAQLGGSSNLTTTEWSTSGDGSFDFKANLDAIYTPGSTDISGGSVTLTLKTFATTSTCVDATDDVIVTISVCTGINSDIDDVLTIYPNPAADYVTIDSKINVENYSITSLDGTILESKEFSNSQIDLSNLESGIYILKLKVEGSELVTKIIKE